MFGCPSQVRGICLVVLPNVFVGAWFVVHCRYSPHQGGGERSYGPFFWPNDTVGVVLNMDEGYMAFVKDAEVSVPAHIHQPI